MRDKLLRALGESGTVRRGDALLLAVSGGADSTALLLALHALREELALSLRVLHVHHGLRGEAAERDADFVRALAARYELPFELVRVDVRRAAREERQSLEEAGRELRYRALFAAAERWEKECGGRVKIATAHTEDDAAETVLLQLARGSGLKGAAGIPAIRGRLVRPLLEVSRAEVEAYLGRRGQNFVEDESNATDSFARNRLRRDILPRFRTDINSEAVRHFARAGRYFREADEYFETLAGEKAQVLVQRGEQRADCTASPAFGTGYCQQLFAPAFIGRGRLCAERYFRAAFGSTSVARREGTRKTHCASAGLSRGALRGGTGTAKGGGKREMRVARKAPARSGSHYSAQLSAHRGGRASERPVCTVV